MSLTKYALGKHLARVDGVIGDSSAKVYYYHTDNVGSVRAVTNSIGAVVWNADYQAFGTQFGKNKLDPSFEEDEFAFTGKGYDGDTGLYYYNARWYDSETGRFISEDAKADPNNPNLYVYCGNNPINRTDPTGNGWFSNVCSSVANAITHPVETIKSAGAAVSKMFSGSTSTKSTPTPTNTNSTGQKIADAAKDIANNPYDYHQDKTPMDYSKDVPSEGLDCSDLAGRALYEGTDGKVNIGDFTDTQFNYFKDGKNGKIVDVKDGAKAGDLNILKDPNRKAGDPVIEHVGVVVAVNKDGNTSSGSSTSYWSKIHQLAPI